MNKPLQLALFAAKMIYARDASDVQDDEAHTPSDIVGAQINNELCLILSMLEDGLDTCKDNYESSSDNSRWLSLDSDYRKAIEAVSNIKMLADALCGKDVAT